MSPAGPAFPGPTGRPGPARVVLAGRATDLLVAEVRARGSGTVLVPEPYCPDIPTRLAAAGLRVRRYPLGPDLVADRAALDAARGPDVTATVWLHPFGRFVAPPPDAVGPVEDGCFSLAAALEHGIAHDPDVLVFSPRKEFRWSEGGVAVGRRVLPASVTGPSVALRRAWADVGAGDRPRSFRAAAAAASLGDAVPPGPRPDVPLTVLPLLSGDRDRVVAALRAAGVTAWYWPPGPGTRPSELSARLFFVSAASPAPDPLGLLVGHRLDPWPRPAGPR